MPPPIWHAGGFRRRAGAVAAAPAPSSLLFLRRAATPAPGPRRHIGAFQHREFAHFNTFTKRPTGGFGVAPFQRQFAQVFLPPAAIWETALSGMPGFVRAGVVAQLLLRQRQPVIGFEDSCIYSMVCCGMSRAASNWPCWNSLWPYRFWPGQLAFVQRAETLAAALQSLALIRIWLFRRCSSLALGRSNSSRWSHSCSA